MLLIQMMIILKKNKKPIITGANFTHTFELLYVVLDTDATNHDINT